MHLEARAEVHKRVVCRRVSWRAAKNENEVAQHSHCRLSHTPTTPATLPSQKTNRSQPEQVKHADHPLEVPCWKMLEGNGLGERFQSTGLPQLLSTSFNRCVTMALRRATFKTCHHVLCHLCRVIFGMHVQSTL